MMDTLEPVVAVRRMPQLSAMRAAARLKGIGWHLRVSTTDGTFEAFRALEGAPV